MRAALHRPQPGEIDCDLLVLGVSTGSLAVVAGWAAAGLPLPHCAFRALTGCPCPTCGATRCALALLHGQLGTAWAWNPLACLALLGAGGFNLYAAVVTAARLPRLRLGVSAPEARLLRLAAAAALAGNWCYLAHHGV